MGSEEQKINNENDTEESFEDLLNKTSFTPLYLNPGEQIEPTGIHNDFDSGINFCPTVEIKIN